jgi:hypothetical protein
MRNRSAAASTPGKAPYRVASLGRASSCGFGTFSSEVPPPDPAQMNLLYELGEIAAVGGDIRQRLFS